MNVDDTRTCATTNDFLMWQVKLVKKFAAENYLKLNVKKCEVKVYGLEGGVSPRCEKANGGGRI